MVHPVGIIWVNITQQNLLCIQIWPWNDQISFPGGTFDMFLISGGHKKGVLWPKKTLFQRLFLKLAKNVQNGKNWILKKYRKMTSWISYTDRVNEFGPSSHLNLECLKLRYRAGIWTTIVSMHAQRKFWVSGQNLKK